MYVPHKRNKLKTERFASCRGAHATAGFQIESHISAKAHGLLVDGDDATCACGAKRNAVNARFRRHCESRAV